MWKIYDYFDMEVTCVDDLYEAQEIARRISGRIEMNF